MRKSTAPSSGTVQVESRYHPAKTQFFAAVAFSVTFLPAAYDPPPVTLQPFVSAPSTTAIPSVSVRFSMLTVIVAVSFTAPFFKVNVTV